MYIFKYFWGRTIFHHGDNHLLSPLFTGPSDDLLLIISIFQDVLKCLQLQHLVDENCKYPIHWEKLKWAH